MNESLGWPAAVYALIALVRPLIASALSVLSFVCHAPTHHTDRRRPPPPAEETRRFPGTVRQCDGQRAAPRRGGEARRAPVGARPSTCSRPSRVCATAAEARLARRGDRRHARPGQGRE